MRLAAAAAPTGPATYPPPPSTASAWRCPRILRAAPTAMPARATARAAFSGFERLIPSTLRESSSYPAWGTSSASARSPPTKLTSAPSARSASATAIAGTTWPAVPPAAITIRGGSLTRVLRPLGNRAEMRGAAGRDVQQQPHAGEQHDQRRGAGRDERQRHAGEWREAEHGIDVEQGLAQDQRGHAGGEQLGVGALGLAGGPQAGVPDHAVQAQHGQDADQAELLADDGENEVGVGLGKVGGLLDGSAEAMAEKAAGADRDLALDRLVAGRAVVGPGVHERGQAGAPVRLDDREHEHEERADAGHQRELADRETGGDQHRRERGADDQAGAEVRLRGDQQQRAAADAEDRAGDGSQAAGDLRPRGQHRGGVQDERELHDLARLELQRAGADPAAGAVDADAEAGHQHEQQQRERGEQQHGSEAPDRVERDARDDVHPDQ